MKRIELIEGYCRAGKNLVLKEKYLAFYFFIKRF